LIEDGYKQTGLPLWCGDQAGPYQTVPYPGHHWCLMGEPSRHPHEYVRNGIAKVLTLFHPSGGEVRMKGVLQTTNAILHPWMMAQLVAILAQLPGPVVVLDPVENRRRWERWQEGLTNPFPLPEELPPLRMLLVLDNLQGHHTPSFVCWLIEHGIMPLYTPIGGSWLNLAEPIQGIIAGRALNGHHPQTPEQIIQWLEATARGWNRDPTPFEWDGKRRERRNKGRERRYALPGSAGYTTRPIPRKRAA
jgi:DDE superfamily endonuclease